MDRSDAAAEVRDLHNAVAMSATDSEASTRPPSTTDAELRRMVQDVMAKLAIAPSCDVLEIGCGIGVIGVPLPEW